MHYSSSTAAEVATCNSHVCQYGLTFRAGASKSSPDQRAADTACGAGAAANTSALHQLARLVNNGLQHAVCIDLVNRELEEAARDTGMNSVHCSDTFWEF